MVSKTGEAETITSHYLFALGLYRGLYILNWVYRYYFEGFYDLIAIVAGCVQTILYCDFFYLYITKGEFKSVCWTLNYKFQVDRHCHCILFPSLVTGTYLSRQGHLYDVQISAHAI
jgi:hypothetical protein